MWKASAPAKRNPATATIITAMTTITATIPIPTPIIPWALKAWTRGWSAWVEEILAGENNMNCKMCKYREQVLGFEAEVGLAQESHHHHVEGIGTGEAEPGHDHGHHHHSHDHDHGCDDDGRGVSLFPLHRHPGEAHLRTHRAGRGPAPRHRVREGALPQRPSPGAGLFRRTGRGNPGRREQHELQDVQIPRCAYCGKASVSAGARPAIPASPFPWSNPAWNTPPSWATGASWCFPISSSPASW